MAWRFQAAAPAFRPGVGGSGPQPEDVMKPNDPNALSEAKDALSQLGNYADTMECTTNEKAAALMRKIDSQLDQIPKLLEVGRDFARGKIGRDAFEKVFGR